MRSGGATLDVAGPRWPTVDPASLGHQGHTASTSHPSHTWSADMTPSASETVMWILTCNNVKNSLRHKIIIKFKIFLLKEGFCESKTPLLRLMTCENPVKGLWNSTLQIRPPFYGYNQHPTGLSESYWRKWQRSGSASCLEYMERGHNSINFHTTHMCLLFCHNKPPKIRNQTQGEHKCHTYGVFFINIKRVNG